MKKILILTGSGALVGSKFYKNLIKKINQDYNIVDDKDYPYIVLHNIPLNCNYKGELEDKNELKKILDNIDVSSFDNIYFLCNSLTNELENILENKKFINIIKISEKKIKDNQTILFGSKSTFNKQLYRKTNYYKHTKRIQNEMDEIIYLSLKNDKEAKKLIKEKLLILKDYFDILEISNIILSCTDLYLIKKEIKKVFGEDYKVFCSTSLYLKEVIKNLKLKKVVNL